MGAEIWIKYVALVAIGGLYLLRRARRIQNVRRPSLKSLWRDENASARSIDFVLTTITVLPIILGTVQFLFVLNATLFVKYAAFAAARSAAVVIPEDYEAIYRAPGEGRNRVGPEKRRTILECAAWAVSPVSPTRQDIARNLPSFGSVSYTEILAYASRYYPGVWLVAIAPLQLEFDENELSEFTRFDTWEHKAGNAMLQTDVEIIPEVTNGNPFAPNEPVTVKVRYRYNLTVPIARDILKDYSLFFGGPSVPQYFESSRAGGSAWYLGADVNPYVTLSATTTTINEGWGDNPQQFTQPAVRRPSGLDRVWQAIKDMV